MQSLGKIFPALEQAFKASVFCTNPNRFEQFRTYPNFRGNTGTEYDGLQKTRNF